MELRMLDERFVQRPNLQWIQSSSLAFAAENMVHIWTLDPLRRSAPKDALPFQEQRIEVADKLKPVGLYFPQLSQTDDTEINWSKNLMVYRLVKGSKNYRDNFDKLAVLSRFPCEQMQYCIAFPTMAIVPDTETLSMICHVEVVLAAEMVDFHAEPTLNATFPPSSTLRSNVMTCHVKLFKMAPTGDLIVLITHLGHFLLYALSDKSWTLCHNLTELLVNHWREVHEDFFDCASAWTIVDRVNMLIAEAFCFGPFISQQGETDCSANQLLFSIQKSGHCIAWKLRTDLRTSERTAFVQQLTHVKLQDKPMCAEFIRMNDKTGCILIGTCNGKVHQHIINWSSDATVAASDITVNLWNSADSLPVTSVAAIFPDKCKENELAVFASRGSLLFSCMTRMNADGSAMIYAPNHTKCNNALTIESIQHVGQFIFAFTFNAVLRYFVRCSPELVVLFDGFVTTEKFDQMLAFARIAGAVVSPNRVFFTCCFIPADDKRGKVWYDLLPADSSNCFDVVLGDSEELNFVDHLHLLRKCCADAKDKERWTAEFLARVQKYNLNAVSLTTIRRLRCVLCALLQNTSSSTLQLEKYKRILEERILDAWLTLLMTHVCCQATMIGATTSLESSEVYAQFLSNLLMYLMTHKRPAAEQLATFLSEYTDAQALANCPVLCSICQAPEAHTTGGDDCWRLRWICQNGHTFDRCTRTLLPLQEFRWQECNLCSTKVSGKLLLFELRLLLPDDQLPSYANCFFCANGRAYDAVFS